MVVDAKWIWTANWLCALCDQNSLTADFSAVFRPRFRGSRGESPYDSKTFFSFLAVFDVALRYTMWRHFPLLCVILAAWWPGQTWGQIAHILKAKRCFLHFSSTFKAFVFYRYATARNEKNVCIICTLTRTCLVFNRLTSKTANSDEIQHFFHWIHLRRQKWMLTHVRWQKFSLAIICFQVLINCWGVQNYISRQEGVTCSQPICIETIKQFVYGVKYLIVQKLRRHCIVLFSGILLRCIWT